MLILMVKPKEFITPSFPPNKVNQIRAKKIIVCYQSTKKNLIIFVQFVFDLFLSTSPISTLAPILRHHTKREREERTI